MTEQYLKKNKTCPMSSIKMYVMIELIPLQNIIE